MTCIALTLVLAFVAPQTETKDPPVPRVDSRRARHAERVAIARLATAKQQIVELQKMVDLFYVMNARMPASWDDLLAADATGRRYLDGDAPPGDPWGREYRLVAGDRANLMWVVSLGPDGEADTSDDIDSRVARLQPEHVLASLTDLDGKVLDVRALDGRVVVLHFWSARCPSAEHAAAETARLAAAHPDGIAVLAVASQADEIGARPYPKDFAADAARRPYELLRDRAQRQGIQRVLVDHGGRAARCFGARMTAHCVVLDRQRRVVYAGAVDDDPRGERHGEVHRHVNDAVEALLATRTVEWPWPEAHGTPLRLDPLDGWR